MTDNTGKAQLDAYLSRLDKLDEDRAAIAEDTKDLWTEIKSSGFDTKALRKVYSLRKLEKDQLAQIELYADALDLFGGMKV